MRQWGNLQIILFRVIWCCQKNLFFDDNLFLFLVWKALIHSCCFVQIINDTVALIPWTFPFVAHCFESDLTWFSLLSLLLIWFYLSISPPFAFLIQFYDVDIWNCFFFFLLLLGCLLLSSSVIGVRQLSIILALLLQPSVDDIGFPSVHFICKTASHVLL